MMAGWNLLVLRKYLSGYWFGVGMGWDCPHAQLVGFLEASGWTWCEGLWTTWTFDQGFFYGLRFSILEMHPYVVRCRVSLMFTRKLYKKNYLSSQDLLFLS